MTMNTLVDLLHASQTTTTFIYSMYFFIKNNVKMLFSGLIWVIIWKPTLISFYKWNGVYEMID